MLKSNRSVVAAMACLAAVAGPAAAATYVVDPTVPAGTVDSGSGHYGTIQDAIYAAWGTAGSHTVELLPGTFTNQQIGGVGWAGWYGTLEFSNWQHPGLRVASQIDVVGAGPGLTTIADGGGATGRGTEGLIAVYSHPISDLTFSNLTFDLSEGTQNFGLIGGW